MEARIYTRWASAVARRVYPLLLIALLIPSLGASARSRNFVVQTADPTMAREFAETAERCRRELSIAWLGEPMPDWSAPCPITVRVGENLGAGGATTFVFDQGEVFGWEMNIQGSRERVLDSVLPHEVTHMVMASHFRRPLPRWADEGAATSVEYAGERDKHYQMLKQFLCTQRGIAFNRMFAMTEYPRDVMPLYAQGFSLVDYLIQQGGRRKFVAFLEDGLQANQWSAAVRRHYGIADLGALQTNWLAWIRQGHPDLQPNSISPETASPTLMAKTSWPAAEASFSAAPARSIRRPMNGPADRVATAAPTGNPRMIDAGPMLPIEPAERTLGATRASFGPRTAAPLRLQMARPQPVEEAKQVILEWVKPDMAAVPMAGETRRY